MKYKLLLTIGIVIVALAGTAAVVYFSRKDATSSSNPSETVASETTEEYKETLEVTDVDPISDEEIERIRDLYATEQPTLTEDESDSLTKELEEKFEKTFKDIYHMDAPAERNIFIDEPCRIEWGDRCIDVAYYYKDSGQEYFDGGDGDACFVLYEPTGTIPNTVCSQIQYYVMEYTGYAYDYFLLEKTDTGYKVSYAREDKSFTFTDEDLANIEPSLDVLREDGVTE